MELQIHGRNVDVTDWIHEYVHKKVGRLERYLPQAREARVELNHRQTRATTDRYTAQLTIWSNGQILRAEESSGDIFAAIDIVVDKMYRQIERFKGRRFQRKRRSAAASALSAEMAASLLEEVSEEEEEAGPHIVRTKRFVVQPMDAEEAVEHMELVGHDFYVFYNVESSSINVIYRRKDGNYGLLQPELA
jgi:putative sigma-54 modulation protein